MSKVVAIIQSSYIPWKGYFDMIRNVDLFIFYDHVQYTKKDWRSRNFIKTPKGKKLITIPVGYDTERKIYEVPLPDKSWQRSHWARIKQNYRKSKYFWRYSPFVEEIYLGKQWDNLSEFNTLVVAVQPEGNDNLINDSVLKNFKGKLISVSRSNVIDNYALHENINNISHAYVDTLDSNLREELLETKKVTYTKHTAFEYNFTYENNTQYFINLQNTIDKCLDNNIDNAILSRGERVLF